MFKNSDDPLIIAMTKASSPPRDAAGKAKGLQYSEAFLLLKRRTSRFISLGVFEFNLEKFITLFNIVILHSAFSESEKKCARSVLRAKRVNRNLK